MSEPIIVSSLTQTGRLSKPDPNQPRVFLTYNANFDGASDITLDLTVINQGGIFGTPQSLFMDNGSNPSEVEVTVTGTDQFFTVPPYAQGIFKVDADQSSKIQFVTDGGATDRCTITLYNYEVAPSVWYRFGTFNNDKPIMVEGTIEDGEDIDTASAKNGVLVAGKSDTTGQIRYLSVDQTGRVRVIGAAVGGNIFGTDAIGSAPTQAPVFIAGLNAGNIIALNLDAFGNLVLPDNKSDTSNFTNIASANINTALLADNPIRNGATFFNSSTQVLYLLLDDSAASIANYSVQVEAGGYYEIPFNYTGAVNGVWPVANGSVKITEFF